MFLVHWGLPGILGAPSARLSRRHPCQRWLAPPAVALLPATHLHSNCCLHCRPLLRPLLPLLPTASRCRRPAAPPTRCRRRYAVTQLAQTTMRSELGKISLDKTFEEREMLNANIIAAIQ